MPPMGLTHSLPKARFLANADDREPASSASSDSDDALPANKCKKVRGRAHLLGFGPSEWAELCGSCQAQLFLLSQSTHGLTCPTLRLPQPWAGLPVCGV